MRKLKTGTSRRSSLTPGLGIRTSDPHEADPVTDVLYCVELNLPKERVDAEDAIEGALWEYADLGVERQDDTTFSQLVEDLRPREPGSIRWRLYLHAPMTDTDLSALRREAAGAEVLTWTLDDLSFLTSWKEHFRPARVSERVWVHPPWEIPALGGCVGVEIEPGMAFGTGTHATTRLCIAALDRLVGDDSPTVLDVGCGSGVLTIAAGKLGARVLSSVDNDPDAVRIANENLVRNGEPAVASTTDVADLTESAELVVANILPHVLIDMSGELTRLTAAGGTLVLSGIVVEQLAKVEEHFLGRGFSRVRLDSEGDWQCITLRRAP